MESYTLYYSIGTVFSGHGPTRTKSFDNEKAARAYYETCKADWYGKVKDQWDAYPHLKSDEDWYEDTNLDAELGEIANFGGEWNWRVFDFTLMKD